MKRNFPGLSTQEMLDEFSFLETKGGEASELSGEMSLDPSKATKDPGNVNDFGIQKTGWVSVLKQISPKKMACWAGNSSFLAAPSNR